ncbi:MAG: glycosyltransferase, partial [Chloroflexi bacterium]|nr:glycosyltransferase [Chloroflexota bacterium]
MRVAQLIDNLKWGGAQKMMAQLAQALAERQHEITVISLGSSNT